MNTQDQVDATGPGQAIQLIQLTGQDYTNLVKTQANNWQLTIEGVESERVSVLKLNRGVEDHLRA